MWENIMKFIRKITKKEDQALNSKDAAKERLHLVLMQDRANVSADFLELMKQEIIEVIKKYIDIDETAIDVRLTNKDNGDGTKGAPALYANIPIVNIKDEVRQNAKTNTETLVKQETSENVQKVEETKQNGQVEKETKPVENEASIKTDANDAKTENHSEASNKNSQNGENIEKPKEIIHEEPKALNQEEEMPKAES